MARGNHNNNNVPVGLLTHKSFLVVACTVLLTFSHSSYAAEPTSKVVELTSDTFEHHTQAATGMTTGDWFVLFYAPWCGHCKRIAEPWEETARLLDQKVNVARVACTTEQAVCGRFEIKGFPTLIFFSRGKMTYYDQERAAEEFERFALSRGGEDANWVDIPEYHPFWESVEASMIKLMEAAKNSSPEAVEFLEEFIESNHLSSDPMINAVFVGLCLGAVILVFVLFIMCVCESCVGGKSHKKGNVPTMPKKSKAKDSDSENDDTEEKKPAEKTVRRRTVKATTD